MEVAWGWEWKWSRSILRFEVMRDGRDFDVLYIYASGLLTIPTANCTFLLETIQVLLDEPDKCESNQDLQLHLTILANAHLYATSTRLIVHSVFCLPRIHDLSQCIHPLVLGRIVSHLGLVERCDRDQHTHHSNIWARISNTR